ncbi:putative NADH dehydrogenase [Amylocarpus encephaloides]|uniref:NADH dehydrogenase n=1 Tax=Amylocarpus encephaloides TaxID=45428 RepID=A0A9P8C9Y7_9HELO|nr:putative NADH dehydrogenase [Amylocarpus encephaloides]
MASISSLVQSSKPTLVILGTGWAGWTLVQELACSIFDFRMAEEPVRRLSLSPNVQKYQVLVQLIDLDKRTIKCTPAIGSNGDARRPSSDGLEASSFKVSYDKLVLAPGSETNTFGTPGVLEHCYIMKSVSDAMKLREKILDCLELASLPTCSEDQKRDLLHFAIVGGGPTGVELAAEIDELVHRHLGNLYSRLKDHVTVSVYDVADRLLGSFGENLSEYAMERFRRRNVKIRTSMHIEGFEKGVMKVKEDGEVGFGLCVWAAGNKACELVENLEVLKSESGMERILTDDHLRVLLPSKSKASPPSPSEGVYALGDAADIKEGSLPTTAEVAVQKAEWLAKYLSGKTSEPFRYQKKALVAYIGRGDGVVEGKSDWTGTSAWLAWRSGNLEWARSWRRRAMIWVYWVLNWSDGREVARR